MGLPSGVIRGFKFGWRNARWVCPRHDMMVVHFIFGDIGCSGGSRGVSLIFADRAVSTS